MAKKTKKTANQNVTVEQFKLVSIHDLKLNGNYRKTVSEDELIELSESIKTVGLIQPLTVRQTDKGFQIVCGEKRYRAALKAGLLQLPVIVRELDDDQVLEIQIIENLQRSDPHPLDEAEGYERLLITGRFTKESIAERIGKSTAYIHKRLQLMNLKDEIKEAFYTGTITHGAAVVLARVDQPVQKKAFDVLKKQPDMPASQLQQHIKTNFFLELKEAPFDLEDKTLVEETPDCFSCPKRTGFNKNLFEDLESEDYCMDKHCWDCKIQSHIAKVIYSDKEIKAVSLKYQTETENLIPRMDYQIIGSKDEEAELKEDEDCSLDFFDAIVAEVEHYNASMLGKIIRIGIEKPEPETSADDEENDVEVNSAEGEEDEVSGQIIGDGEVVDRIFEKANEKLELITSRIKVENEENLFEFFIHHFLGNNNADSDTCKYCGISDEDIENGDPEYLDSLILDFVKNDAVKQIHVLALLYFGDGGSGEAQDFLQTDFDTVKQEMIDELKAKEEGK